MSPQLVTCLIAVAANLIGMMIIYTALSNALARRRSLAAAALLLISQLFWIVPALWVVDTHWTPHGGAYALWFGNWLVCGFSLVIFQKAQIPVSLTDAARMDGLGTFAAWRQTVLPFVGRDLLIVAVFTVMATLLPFWSYVTLPEAGNQIVLFERFLSPSGRVTFMAAMSLAGGIPLFAIFFFAKGRR
jgi:ABC-type glycerol-3-phosphate transport system permease component